MLRQNSSVSVLSTASSRICAKTVDIPICDRSVVWRSLPRCINTVLITGLQRKRGSRLFLPSVSRLFGNCVGIYRLLSKSAGLGAIRTLKPIINRRNLTVPLIVRDFLRRTGHPGPSMLATVDWAILNFLRSPGLDGVPKISVPTGTKSN